MPAKFPGWVPLGGLLLAALFLPTLSAPFDFIDDGNLVYPAPVGTTLLGHAQLWWAKVQANYEHLGPFRPVLWLHWELFANLSDGDPVLWRSFRLLFCAFSAMALLALLRELRLPPATALIAAGAALWNPYRSEIWTSLTLAEGIAMPYALFALFAARRAAHSPAPVRWELLAMACTLAALGCKNTYAAIIPVQMLLRLWPEGLPFRAALRQNGLRVLLLLLPAVLPALHFAYFKLNWHPGQYETHGPTLAQAGRLLNGYKGGMGLDFLGLGVLLAAGIAAVKADRSQFKMIFNYYRIPIAAALLLAALGAAAYLPMTMMSGRYTMPGIWGLDILFAVGLASLAAIAEHSWRRVARAGISLGLVVLAAVAAGRQDKVSARSQLLWDAVHYTERHAPQGATIAWISGDSARGELNVEEGIHFRWHLLHRGRGDLQIQLVNARGERIERVELPRATAEPLYVVAGASGIPAGWDEVQPSERRYWLGRKAYTCVIGGRVALARKQ
jgi:hypothetical protein